MTGEPAELLEVPLTVPGESVPSTVRAGSVVDVWVAPGPERGLAGGESPDATLVLEDVQVVSVSRGSTALGPATARQVIVGVEAADEGALPEALAGLADGSVVLVRQP